MSYKIAIDGPAGSGKSTVSKIIAERYNLYFISTGYFFRAYALILRNNNLLNADVEAQIDCLNKHSIDIVDNKLFINKKDLTIEAKTEQISDFASELATKKEIRDYSKKTQSIIANNKDVIMDGRDIGTVIMPDANLKIFLIASIKERAHRRLKELKELNIEETYWKVWIDIFKRDWNDKHRKVAPLKKANDAIVVNTDNKTIEQVVEEICGHINK